jgi:hypothetical protein
MTKLPPNAGKIYAHFAPKQVSVFVLSAARFAADCDCNLQLEKAAEKRMAKGGIYLNSHAHTAKF